MPTLVVEKNVADERGTLLAFVEAQRGGLRRALLGLTDEQAAQKPSASELSLSGLVKHVAEVEQIWVRMAQGREPDTKRDQSTWGEAFRLAEDETVAGVLAFWDRATAETEEFIRSVPSLEDTFPLPEAPWFPADTRVSMRWLLLHLIEEFARHAGHADVIRESLDGKTAFELVAEAAQASGGGHDA
ncbi:DinB family protein [Streptomyces roseoverticillatus]|uniref:DinB family protein n=1 Tax=Streptomyces roseoverticillatus TaxID=66429 RepID=UPI001F46FB83|nr:DinB family protein [Streptomyces roseoverticillatus]MCF3100489.1 DinB family protein [Streptomyces roseoverticillatus]